MRTPLTKEARADLKSRREAGDRSMLCHFDGMGLSPRDALGDPCDGSVRLGPGKRKFTPDEARVLAVALLEAADHAEFFHVW